MSCYTPKSKNRRRKACQYCGEPESMSRVRVGYMVCFDCAEPGGRHDQETATNSTKTEGADTC